jgi:hypothetical protein
LSKVYVAEMVLNGAVRFWLGGAEKLQPSSMIGGTCFGVLVCPGLQDYSNRRCEYRNVSFDSDTLFLLISAIDDVNLWKLLTCYGHDCAVCSGAKI